MDNKDKKSYKRVMIAGGIILAGVAGFLIGSELERNNSRFIWMSTLACAKENGSTKIFWESGDKTRTQEFLISFIEERLNQ